MKKNSSKGEITLFIYYKQLLKIMKISLILIFATSLSISASLSYAQQTKLSLKLKNATVRDILNEIGKKSEFSFWYKNDELSDNSKISMSIKDQTIDKILEIALQNQELSYEIKDKVILIYKTPKPGAVLILQQMKVTGVVQDALNNEPVVGANVLIEGTTIGVVTDENGKFSIDIPKSDVVLLVSFLGYNTERVILNGQNSLEIKLIQDITKLEEVVVVGYGTQKKAVLTTAIANVKSDDFVKGSVIDAGQLLQGKIAGLTIVQNSADPTGKSQILLRGTATLSTSTQPYILIDGIPGDLNTVAPDDIESIDVLKDGSAAAIYGTRGTNGVILISTKRAKGNEVSSVEYSSYVSTQQITKKPDFLDAAGFREFMPKGQDMGANTDWIDAIMRKPVSHSHSLTVRGGNQKTNFIATGVYRSIEGLVLKSDSRTMNARFDVNHKMFKDKLILNIGFLGSNNKQTATADPRWGPAFNTFIYRQALEHNPTEPLKNADGSWYENTNKYFYANPMALIYETDGEITAATTRMNGGLTWKPIEGLNIKAMVSQQKISRMMGYYETVNSLSNLKDKKHGVASRGTSQSTERLLDLTADYTKTINKHNFTVLAGYSYIENLSEYLFANNYGYPTDAFSYYNLGIGSALALGKAGMAGGKDTKNLIAFFGRLNYNFNEKYLLMASLRREAASQFVGTEKPWGSFPAVSVGWRINKENFMSDLTFINELKIRVGYGVTGTAPDASFLAVSRLGYSGYFLNNGIWSPTLVPASNPNPDLKWEEKHETNIGFDFSLFSDRISGSVDYYNRETRGLLYDYQVPSPPNLFPITKANVGTMENKGIEVLVNIIPVQTNNFTWSANINFSTNTNKLVSLQNDIYKLTNDFFYDGVLSTTNNTHRIKVGDPIGNFFGYKVVDIGTDGKWIYQLPDGTQVDYTTFNKSHKNNNSKMILGNGLPKYYAGLNQTFRYKNIDLGITMRGAFKFQILNATRVLYENPTMTQTNLLRSAFDKVYGKQLLTVNETDWNSYYLEDGDYWKIDNITLGYNLNTPKLKFIKNARIYVSTLNTFILSGYSGMDPEVNSLGLHPGTDERDRYPNARTYTCGIKVTF